MDDKNMNAESSPAPSYEPEQASVTKLTFKDRFSQTKTYLSSKGSWFGDYDYWYLVTPNIPPFNRKYKDKAIPFYGLHDRVPIFLTIILGLQHALTMIGSIVSPPLAIASGAFNLEPAQVSYFVAASFITTGIAVSNTFTELSGASHWFGRLTTR